MEHPQSHLWTAARRRFADQRSPSTSPEHRLRGLCLVPLDGQEESPVFSAGYREAGSVLRTVSLSRDFQGLAELVSGDAERPCYLVVFVGDVQQVTSTVAAEGGGDWILLAYVPATCSSFEAKRMADARAALKADLGAEAFGAAAMWCVSPEQITLSNYMRLAGAEAGAAASPARPATALAPAVFVADGESAEEQLSDANEAVWEERIKGVRHAYADSCTRLVGALEELEQTLCGLTGSEYRADEPLLHARAHMKKNLEVVRGY